MNSTRLKTAPLRIGILGCANIAKQFSRDVAPSPAVRIVAVASRNADTAAAFAATQGIGRHHGSYEALLARLSQLAPDTTAKLLILFVRDP